MKAAYETTVGRLTELVAAHHTDEDRFAASTATAYGAFMQTVPWYEFPFGSTVRALWRETGWWGPGPVRKWERKLALKIEIDELGAPGLAGATVKNPSIPNLDPIVTTDWERRV